jgi:hypothetical protein
MLANQPLGVFLERTLAQIIQVDFNLRTLSVTDHVLPRAIRIGISVLNWTYRSNKGALMVVWGLSTAIVEVEVWCLALVAVLVRWVAVLSVLVISFHFIQYFIMVGNANDGCKFKG